MKRILPLLVLLGIAAQAYTQAFGLFTPQNQKGKFYFYWGWNRGFYTHSDIRFHGPGYDFTLDNVRAVDKFEKIGIDPYFSLTKLTIPQTNVRVGYFFKPNYSISLGIDHMKYVMVQNQTSEITGSIAVPGNPFDGTYDHQPIELTRNFLTFEHTDGLNYCNAELRRHDRLLTFRKSRFLHFDVEGILGIGVGALVPKTNVRLFGQPRHDVFHLSGIGTGALAGVSLRFWDAFFVQTELKGGYIGLPSVTTTFSNADRASHQFLYTQWNVVLGGTIPLFKQ
jgi:hypothetical protein